jgi:phosphoribosylaminoimidazolecarboxamide formyltransferase/IMP cyclohydrolase
LKEIALANAPLSAPSAADRAAPRRALLSVFDKTGLIEVARALRDLGVELVSTGGTRAAIAAAGLPVTDVSALTGYPEMMDGRVKTLHPVVHGGLLAVRDAPEHARAMAEHGIGGIDLLYVSLYPFEETVAAGGDFATCVENIDIGGPAMIRSAAKNHAYVAVCTTPEDMAEVLAALKADGATDLALRKRLAARAYARTAAYDAAIASWFAHQAEEGWPKRKSISGELAQSMLYGENPHQPAAFYRFPHPRVGVATARVLQGRALGYNNIKDRKSVV